MNKIIINPEFTISKDNNKKTLFEIKFSNKYLLYSLTKTKIIKNYTILDNGKTIILKATSIKMFSEFKKEQNKLNKTNKLSYPILLKLIYYLSKQLDYLMTNDSKCFYTYDPNNIIVIDDSIFIYLSQEHLKDVKKDEFNNNNIHIYSPISTSNLYLSPELSSAKILPIMINYKTIFYSLGLLISENLSSSISETKLNYFLERCLNKDPCERYLLYI